MLAEIRRLPEGGIAAMTIDGYDEPVQLCAS